MRARLKLTINFFLFIISLTPVAFAVPPNVYPIGLYNLNSKELPDGLKKQLSMAAKAVGRIIVVRRQDHAIIGQGTGFVVEPGNIVYTNFHIFRGNWLEDIKTYAVFIEIEGEKDPVQLTHIVGGDLRLDVCYVKATKQLGHTIKALHGFTPVPGMRTAILGHPFGNRQKKVSLGHVIGPQGDLKGQFVLTATSVPGMSGSPVLIIDRDGNIAGSAGTDIGYESLGKVLGERAENLRAQHIYYFTFDRANRLLETLTHVEDPIKEFDIKEKGKGEYESTILNRVFAQGGIVPQILEGLGIVGSNSNLQIELKKVDELISSYSELRKETAANRIKPGDEIIERVATLANETLLRRIETMRIAPVIFDVPVRPQNEIKDIFGNKALPVQKLLSNIDRAISDLNKTKERIKRAFSEYEAKIRFFSSPGECAKLLIALSKDPGAAERESFYHRYIFAVPSHLNILPAQRIIKE